jgi:steroid 5-alpha reductase family enzyme
MNNPNALAALVSSQAALAVEQLVGHYLNASVGSFWSQEIMAAAIAAVLYVGRNGLRAALLKVLTTARSLWIPRAQPPVV